MVFIFLFLYVVCVVVTVDAGGGGWGLRTGLSLCYSFSFVTQQFHTSAVRRQCIHTMHIVCHSTLGRSESAQGSTRDIRELPVERDDLVLAFVFVTNLSLRLFSRRSITRRAR